MTWRFRGPAAADGSEPDWKETWNNAQDGGLPAFAELTISLEGEPAEGEPPPAWSQRTVFPLRAP
mgnify:CR=1 FL=1